MALAPYNMPFSSLDPALRPVAGALPVMVARRLNHAVTLFAGVVFMIGAASAVFAGSVPLLAHAAKDRDATTVSVLLKQGADVNDTLADGSSALLWAAQWNDVPTATLLVKAGARVNLANDYGATPLSLAATNGSAPMVRLLLGAGARPDTASPSGEPALMTAARSGSVDAVRALLDAGADVNASEPVKQQTALMWAVAEAHGDVVGLLLERGAALGAKSSSGFTALLFAARVGNRDLVSLFLDRGVDINTASDEGLTPLLVAVVRGHASRAEWLLSRGADPNKDTAGYAPLHWAAGTFDTMSTKEYTTESGEWSALAGIVDRDAKLSLINALIARGADVNVRVKGRLPRFGYTLGGGSIVGGGSYAGATPFFLATAVGDIGIMRLLLGKGADPNIATNDRTTPLMAAAGVSIVEAETSASEAQLLEALKLTMTLGNQVTAANEAENTALHATAFVGFNVIAKFLVESGAALNARNKKGETPLKIATGVPLSGMFYSQPTTAALLRSLGGTE